MLGGSTTPVLEGSRYCPYFQADRCVRHKQALETNLTYSYPFQVGCHLVDRHVKPAVLSKVDPRIKFGTVPDSSTSEALVSIA